MGQPDDYTYNPGAEAAWADYRAADDKPPYGDYWNVGNGSWTNAGDWTATVPTSSGPQTANYVPGLDDAVYLSSSASTPYTITYYAIDEIWSLSSNPGVTLDITGGSLTVDHNSFGFESIDVAAGASLNAASGAGLEFSGGTIAGTLGGLGTITLGPGDTALNSGTSLQVSNLTINGGNGGATVTLGVSLSYGGVFTMAGEFDTLDLDDKVLTLTGTSDALSTGNIGGGGTLDVTGAASVGQFSVGYGSTGAATIIDAGSMTQTSTLSLNGELQINAGKTYSYADATVINPDGSGATILNNGTFTDADPSGGLSRLNGTFTNKGTLTVDANDTLVLSGADTLAGKLAGAGTLVFGGGTYAINTTSVTVAGLTFSGGNGGATVTLDDALTYTGVFDMAGEFDTLDLNGRTLTLTGKSDSLSTGDVNGAGTLKVTGVTSVGGFTVGYDGAQATIEDLGSMTQSGTLSLNGELLIDAGKTYSYTDTTVVNSFGAGATIINNGSFADSDLSGGLSRLNGTFTNSGTLTVRVGDTLVLSGTDTLGGTLNGAGTLVLGGGSYAINTTSVTTGGLTFNGGNGGATVTLDDTVTYTGVFDMAGEFDTLDLNGHTLTLTGKSDRLSTGDVNGAGVLEVTGAATVGQFTVGYDGTQATIEDAGSMTQSSTLSLNGELLINAAKTYSFTDTTSINSFGTGATIVNNGTFTDADTSGGLSRLNGTFTNNGTLTIDANDMLAVSGSDTLHGSIGGSGTLGLGGGTFTLDTSSLKVGGIEIDGGNGGATVTLDEAITYAGTFDMFGQFDTVNLNGHNLTLEGTTDIAAGEITGGSLLFAGGMATISDPFGLDMTSISVRGASTTLDITANISYGDSITLGAGATLAIAVDDTLTLQGPAVLDGVVNGPGTLALSGSKAIATIAGDAAIAAGFTAGSGTEVAIAASDQLTLTGDATLSGEIVGGGTLDLAGDVSVASGAKLLSSRWTISGGATTLEEADAYGGAFSLSGGAFDLTTGAFTLTNGGVFTGGEVDGNQHLNLEKTSSEANLTIGGTVELVNLGTVDQSGGSLSLGDSSGGTAILDNSASGVFDISDNSGIGLDTSTASHIVNLGLLEKTGGTQSSAIAPSIVNDGTILSSSGMLVLQRAMVGAGADQVEDGATLQVDSTVAATQSFAYGTGGGEFALSDLDAGGKDLFAGSISGFGAGDSLDALHFGTGMTWKYVPGSGDSGMLELTDGSLHANIDFSGNYTNANFTPNTTSSGTLFTFHS